MGNREGYWRWKGAAILLLSLLIAVAENVSCCAAEIPTHFTKDAIMAAGVEDENFAEAIYESIAEKIENDSYFVDVTWDTTQILENYKDENLIGELAVIEATRRNIKSIEGIKLLKNTFEIYLNENEIHDLGPLKRDVGNSTDKLYFNNTHIRIANGNFQNIIPSELIGTFNGNITVDSTMSFEPVQLNYLYDGQAKEVGLDFGLQLHGAAGGVFNQAYSEAETENKVKASWTTYADYTKRYTGTRIRFPGLDGSLRIAANANENLSPYMPATVHYWSDNLVERKLNLVWNYPFETLFYRSLRQNTEVELRGGIVLTKTNPEGEGLEDARYELYRVQGAVRSRYPDADTFFTTDVGGGLVISALPEGTYELVETDAPEGYLLDKNPISVEVRPDPVMAAERIVGGYSEITITEDGAEFQPQWDSIKEKDTAGHTHTKHIMRMKSGSTRLLRAEALGVDCFIRNGGEGLQNLKGELNPGTGYREGSGTELRLYAGATELGVYHSAGDLRTALNQILTEKGMDEDFGNLRIEAHFVYEQTDPSRFTVVRQVNEPKQNTPPGKDEPKPLSIERLKQVRVKKIWSQEHHPARALFRLLLILGDRSTRVVGKTKEAGVRNGWTAEWSFREIRRELVGTSSDALKPGAGKGSDSNASPSNARLYDEDGVLLDGMVLDDLILGIRVEEVDTPEGWSAEYSEGSLDSQGNAMFQVLNRRKPERPDEPTEPERPGKPDEPDDPESPKEPGRPKKPEHPGRPTEPRGPIPPEQPPVSELPEHPGAPRPEPQEHRIIKRLVGLPYGRIGEVEGQDAIRRVRARVPEMGEEAGNPMLRLALIWAVAVFLYLLTTALRDRLGKGRGEKKCRRS
ncbi:Cna protein B-type domain-containing protein [Fusobacterium naviforme]|nr:Cna protein B-type domain-containing protein [Fusobacterium naviforme]STO28372.1 Beta antigen [Fusobacterium naviforme]